MVGLGDKVDIEAPVISIGTYGDGTVIVNGDYVRGEITLTGSTSDDLGIKSVKLSFDSGLTFLDATVASDELSWSYTIDTATVDDGEKDIIVLVSDTSATPKTSEERLLLYFDNTKPLVLITDPTGYDDPEGKPLAIIPIKGETYDQFRIRSVEISLLSGDGTVDTIEGTASWTSALRSTGTGAYTVSVVATDYAGNVSEGFYHLEDIMEVNADTYITVKDIYDIREGFLVQDAGLLTAADLTTAEIHLTELPITIDLSLDEPQIAISNPDPAAEAAQNVLPANATAFGSISDNYAVQPDSVTISIDGGAYISVSSTSGSGAFIQWEHDLSVLGSGEHTLQIYAEDITGVFKYSTEVGFIINLGAPVVTIISPTLGEYKNESSFIINGLATDAEGITDIEISIDNEEPFIPVDSFTNSTSVNWTYTTGSLSDGTHSFKVKASDDGASTWSYSNLQVTVDITDPTTSFYLPSNNSFVNGEVEIRGASSDNNSLLKTEIKVGDSRAWVELDDAVKYNWTYTINSLEYENSSDAAEDPVDSGIYKLNVYSRVTDIAGNIVETIAGYHSFYIDNALDRPTVNIVAPSNDVNLGGSVIVSGTSFDDDGAVYGVYMQIDVNTHDGDTPNFTDSVVLSDPIDFDGPGGNAAVGTIDETVWYLVDGKSPWNVELNTNGELYSTEAGHIGDIYIRVRAIDKDGGALSITGEYKELHIRMDDTIPYIENITPVTNSYENGVFNISGDVVDETQIKHLEISYNGGADYHYIIRNNVIESGYSGYGIDTVTTNYTINIDLNTAAVPEVGNVVSDDITIRLKVTDSTNYQTLYSLHYYIDNQNPTGGITTDLSDINGLDTNATISGTANDSGVVSGVEKVVVYFEKSGTFYNPMNGASTVTEPTDPADATYQIIIDSTTETLSGANSDGDGISEELNIGNPYIWIFKFDSNNIADGPVTLHYHVYDKSGNSVNYTEAGYIRNNAPTIDSITLATDINADGDSLDANESVSFSSGYDTTNFTVKNDRLVIDVNASGGNGTKRYSIEYGGTEKNGTLTNNSLTITDFTGMGDGAVNGSEFTIKVYDSTISDDADETDEMFDEITLNLTFDNVDTIDPVITLNSLLQADQDSSIGHLELEADTDPAIWAAISGTYGDNDPKASGVIIIKGTVTDENNINQISVSSENNPMPTLATWNSGQLESADTGVFVIDSQVFDSSGHTVNFTYKWDTANVNNIAGLDKIISFGAADGSANPATSASKQVDVVPYITSILRDSTNLSTIRSRMGRFPMRRSESLVDIYGFNFRNDGNGNGDYIGINSEKTGNPAVLDSIFSAITLSGSDNYTVTIPSDAPSGWFRIFVNNIEAINNINDNSIDLNKESGGSGSDYWTDDRYIFVFAADTSEYFEDGGGDPQFAAMDIASDGTLYSSWTTYSTSDISYSTIGGAVVDVWHGYDPPEFTDITVNGTNINVLYLANYNGGSGWDSNSATAGGLYLYDDSAPSIRCGRNPSNPTYRFELMYHNETLLQFRNIRVVRGANDQIYTSYYDNASGSIKFSSINDGYSYTVNSSETTDEIPWINIDGGFDAHDTNPGTGLVNQYDSSLSRATSTGSFSSITLDEDNYPVIIYYDSETQTMRLARSDNAIPSGLADWTIQEVFTVGDENYSFSGEYISAIVDGDGYIHIVSYKSSQGKLIYIKSTNNPESGAAYTFGSSITIDTAAGVWADLYINQVGTDYIPYIAYLDSTGINSFNGLKVAWYDASADTDFDSSPDGAWEYSNVPLVNSISNERISLVTANATGVDWTSAIGYKSGSHFYVSYLYPVQ